MRSLEEKLFNERPLDKKLFDGRPFDERLLDERQEVAGSSWSKLKM